MSWLTHAREVTAVSELTLVETLWLAPLLVSGSCQCDRRKRATGGDVNEGDNGSVGSAESVGDTVAADVACVCVGAD